MSWPPDRPALPYVSRHRAVRRGLRDSLPVVRAAAVDVIPPVLAVVSGFGLRYLLPLSGGARDVVALLVGATIYVVLRVVVALTQAPARMRNDWFAWSEPGYPAGLRLLKLAATVPDKVRCRDTCCEVEDPNGAKSFRALLVDEPPGADGEPPLFVTYPSDFPNADRTVTGWHRVRWFIREDSESDQWYEVASHPFAYQESQGETHGVGGS